MLRKLTKIGGLVLLLGFVIATLAFTSLKYKDVACTEIEVSYNHNEAIQVDKDEIIRIVCAADSALLGKKFAHINAVRIEEAVKKHDAVSDAEVYKTVTANKNAQYKGVLMVELKHREPVLRIMSSDGNYYLDASGRKIPVSSNYTANVVVATGNISEKYAREQLLPCVLYIQHDEFWNAQIQQIHVNNNKNLVLTPLVGSYLIELGEVNDYAIKLRNMKAFSRQVLAQGNWNKYQSVSLKYKNQVVAKRR